jgi:hypothetical protein
MSGPADRLSLLQRSLSPTFELRLFALPPGHTRRYREADWRDALVVIERGCIELVCVGGGRKRFVRGDVLWLSGMPLFALHNPGPDAALLAAVSRRRTLSRRPKPAARCAR